MIDQAERERAVKEEDSVKLISAEGIKFVLDKEAAMSPGGFAESQLGEVTFPEISTAILEKIRQYFYWSLRSSRGRKSYFLIEP